MSVTFPAWYEGGFPDSELLVMDLCQTFLDLCTPQGTAVTWISKEHIAMADAGTPIVRVYRSGPGADGLWDPAAVQVAVLASTRADSWAVMEYLRQILLSYEHGGLVERADSSTTAVTTITEMVGPQQLPELNPDHRMVPATFRVECRRPQSLPDYARIRESLSL
ncbi:phage tail termination protein [Nocardia otitidiscaviarum]|uniref:phage tail termination protein n=1 Tax=Nocardia otitidiscaviarum TaxID=1823 RepID=UPI0004A7101F|nr:hypothetical protein [Nocardia otitidiscaviarum]